MQVVPHRLLITGEEREAEADDGEADGFHFIKVYDTRDLLLAIPAR